MSLTQQIGGLLTLSLCFWLLAIWLAIAHPQYHERPVLGVLLCFIGGHPDALRMGPMGGFQCPRCKLKGATLADFPNLLNDDDEGYVGKRRRGGWTKL